MVATNDVDWSEGSDVLWFLFSMLMPFLDLGLYLIWRETRPTNARACLVGWIAGLVMLVLMMVV